MIDHIATYSKVNDCFIFIFFLTIYYYFFFFLTMIVLFHENVLLLSTNNFIVILSVCLWFSRKTNVKRKLIGYWITKERIWLDSKSLDFPHASIHSRGVDITTTQNLLISFKPIICKLNYSHVIMTFVVHRTVNGSL